MNNELSFESFVCKWKECAHIQPFKTVTELSEHLSLLHVGKKAPNYVCHWEGCDRNDMPWPSRSALVAHLRKHTGERPFACHLCNKQFARSDALSKHVKIHHNPNKVSDELACKKFNVPLSSGNKELDELNIYSKALVEENEALLLQLQYNKAKIKRLQALKLLCLNRLLELDAM